MICSVYQIRLLRFACVRKQFTKLEISAHPSVRRHDIAEKLPCDTPGYDPVTTGARLLHPKFRQPRLTHHSHGLELTFTRTTHNHIRNPQTWDDVTFCNGHLQNHLTITLVYHSHVLRHWPFISLSATRSLLVSIRVTNCIYLSLRGLCPTYPR